MNLTHCPVCNTRVLATHRCQARPVDLVPMPTNFKDLVEQARGHDRYVSPVEPSPLFRLPMLEDEE